MRVIKSGREKEWTVTCPRCAADLVYKSEDVVRKMVEVPRFRSFIHSEVEGSHPTEQVINSVVVCPECGEHVKVPDRAQNRKLFLVDGGDWV